VCAKRVFSYYGGGCSKEAVQLDLGWPSPCPAGGTQWRTESQSGCLATPPGFNTHRLTRSDVDLSGLSAYTWGADIEIRSACAGNFFGSLRMAPPTGANQRQPTELPLLYTQDPGK
jgi:hypothetical protein